MRGEGGGSRFTPDARYQLLIFIAPGNVIVSLCSLDVGRVLLIWIGFLLHFPMLRGMREYFCRQAPQPK